MSAIVFVFFCILGAALAITTAPLWLDRVIVWTLRGFNILLFPNAIRLAVSLERDTAEWEFGKFEARHPRIGTIWTGNDAYGLYVQVDEHTQWKPNWIERRIIRDAVEYAIARRIGEHLDKTLPA